MNLYEPVAESSASYLECYGIAHSAPRYTSPKRYTSPSLYRAYSSYPVEGKASFSRRKKHLHVVEFFYLCT